MNITQSIKALKYVFLFIVLSTAFSCATKADMVYFQDEGIGNFSQPVINPDVKYQPGDMLTINVSGLDPDAVRPFNLWSIASVGGQAGQASVQVQTYLVDKNGNIEFPVLGTISIAGLTRLEATELIKNKLEEYVKDPIVNIRISNFTITILGEVNNPGTFTIMDEKVSLTEALGLAGDLTIYGNRKNILLTREIDGQKKFAIFDLTSARVLASKNYYLAQNDVIYVAPNKTRVNTSRVNPNNALLLSSIGTLVTIVAIFFVK